MGTIIGIAAGGGVGLLIVVAAIVYYKKKNKRHVLPSRRGGGEGSCDIFASYKQNDDNDGIVKTLHYELKPLDVWLDKMRGEEVSGIVAGVRSCDLFCAVISPAFFQSETCKLELRTAIREGMRIATCFNGSKHTVQEALAWIPAEFAQLRQDELIKLDEDIEFMEVALQKIRKRLSGKDQSSRQSNIVVDMDAATAAAAAADAAAAAAAAADQQLKQVEHELKKLSAESSGGVIVTDIE